jgi:V8-like Glu-specific endopeptidase
MLQIDERQSLTQTIAALYDFTDAGARGKRLLIQQANLSRFLPGIDLNGPPLLVAADLMSRIENYGNLPEEPTKHALGALLAYLLTLGDLSEDKKSFIAGLIVKYSLVGDPIYLSKLQKDYALNQQIVRQAVRENLAPPDDKAIEPNPPFKVELKNETGLEAVINSEDNFLDVYWLFGAIYSSQAVCRIEVPENVAKGTGFLVGPDLLLTNHHVLRDINYVKDAIARFDYRADNTGVVSNPGRVFKLKTDFYCWSPTEELDYALVRLEGQPLKQTKDNAPLMDLVLQAKHRGYLVARPDFIRENDRVNIIQHPEGRPMKAVMTENYVAADMSDKRVQYVADTMEGSSGSPVFNRNWEVVALHHSGTPYPPDELGTIVKKAWKGRFRVNEGIPMRAILKDFEAQGITQYLPRD